MIVLAALPLVISIGFGLVGPKASRSLSGRTATALITVVSLACALAMGLVACAIGALALAEWTPLAGLGHWSPAVLSAHVRIPRWSEFACLAVGAGLLLASFARVVATARRLLASFALCRGCSTDLVVVDTGPPDAYALAGLPGRIVLTRSMLRALSSPERRALLAHERSHVNHHHFVYLNLVELAAAANPFMRPLVHAAQVAVERWADDDAAQQVGDRRLVATTLARASLAGRGHGLDRPSSALAAVTSDVRQRIDALSTPVRHRHSALIAAALLTAALVAGVSGGLVGVHLHNVVEWAQAVQARRPS